MLVREHKDTWLALTLQYAQVCIYYSARLTPPANASTSWMLGICEWVLWSESDQSDGHINQSRGSRREVESTERYVIFNCCSFAWALFELTVWSDRESCRSHQSPEEQEEARSQRWTQSAKHSWNGSRRFIVSRSLFVDEFFTESFASDIYLHMDQGKSS